MFPWLLSPKNRLRDWKEFKDAFLKKQTDLEQLELVNNYWQQFPIGGFTLDIDSPKLWPSPWELMYEGNLCQNSLAYLMEQTLILGDERWRYDRLELIFMDDKMLSKSLLILVIDNKYTLNYSQNEIINFDIIKETCIIHYGFKVKDKFHYIK